MATGPSCHLVWFVVDLPTDVKTGMGLQRMHVGQHVIDLLRREDVAEAFHLVSAHADDFADAGVVGGNSADGKVLLLEHAFQSGPLPSARRIGIVTAVAVFVIDAASGGLL